MKMNRPLFEPGDIVQHFKRETIKEPHNNEYLYEIVGFAQHTETGEALVIYRALYGGKKLYARPSKMFYGKVDRNRYPEIQQEYRFVKYHGVLYADGL